MANGDPNQAQVPNVDPASLARIASMFGGGLGTPGGQAIPTQPATPAALTGGFPPDLESALTKATTMSTTELPIELQRMRGRQDTIESLAQQAQNIPLPKVGPESTLGKILYAIGGMFRPGQAIESRIYGPGIARYEAERGSIAERIKALQGEQAQEPGALQAISSEGSRMLSGAGMYGRGVGAMMQGSAAVQNAQTQVANVASQVATRLEQIAQGWEKLSQSDRMTTLRETLGPLEIEIKRQMAANPVEVEGIRAGVQQSIANVLSQSKVLQEHGVLADVEGWLNGVLLPIAPQAPGGSQPVRSDQPPPKRQPPAAAAGKVRVQLSDGRTGSVDAKDFDPKTMKKLQ